MEDVRTVVNTVQIKMVTSTIRPLFKYKFLQNNLQSEL